MKNERMMILEMVNEGTISVDEAVKLLNALNKSNINCFDEFAQDIKYNIQNIVIPDAEKIKENTNVFLNKTGNLIDDFANSVKDFFNPTQYTTTPTKEPEKNKDNEDFDSK